MSNALVTGAGRGLGLALARELATRGYDVYATARRPHDSGELQRLAREFDGRVTLLELDVTDEEQIEAAARHIERSHGSLDVLVNNAGIASKDGGGTSTAPEPLDSVDLQNSLTVFAVNTVGPLLTAKGLRSVLARGRNPRILNITSRMGSIEDKSGTGYYSYSASKAALNMANKILSRDLAPDGITAVVAHPGWVRTDMGGSNATLSPAESAAGLVDLLENLDRGDAGTFFNYDGSRLPW